MPAGKYDTVIEQGATFKRTITWKDSAGNPVNVTGYTGRMQIRATVDSPTIIHTLTVANGQITLGGAAGTVTLNIPDETTATFTFTDAVYDLELESGTGDVTRLLEGRLVLSKEVTR